MRTDQAYNGTLFPMAFGFVSLITVSVLLTVLTETPDHPDQQSDGPLRS